MRVNTITGWASCVLLVVGVLACGEDSSSDDSPSSGGAGASSGGDGGTGGTSQGGTGGTATGGSGAAGDGGTAASTAGSSGAGGATGGFAGSADGGTGGSTAGSSGTGGESGGAGGSSGQAGTGGSGELDPSWAACTGPGQCIAMGDDCCGYGCSQEPLSRFIGINRSHRRDLEALLCGPDPQPCPVCGVMFYNEQYVGVCRQGRCQAVDIRQDELSDCDAAADCRLRWGSRCCEMCSEDWSYPPEALMAVSLTVSFQEQLCEPNYDCAACANQEYPTGASVDCVAGHCQVVLH